MRGLASMPMMVKYCGYYFLEVTKYFHMHIRYFNNHPVAFPLNSNNIRFLVFLIFFAMINCYERRTSEILRVSLWSKADTAGAVMR